MPIYERMTIRGRGGALPTYQSQQAPYVSGQGISARLSDSRAGIEAAGQEARLKAIGGLGDKLRLSVNVGLEAANDYAKTKATELATKYKTDMRQSLYGSGGILTREGESAFTSNADAMERSKELRADLLKDMGGSMVEQMFNAIVDPEEAEFSLKAQEYEGKQFRLYQDRTDEAAFKEASESAMFGFSDPKAFAKGTGEALYFQEQLLRRKGYSGEALERGLKESGSKIFYGGIEQAVANDDLASARRLLDEGSREWRPALPHDLSKVGGVVEKGNIDIDNRKVEHRPDGSIATVESLSFNFDGVEVLIPTVIDGKKVSDDEAIAHFMKTGEHLGKFKTPEAATEYATKLHENHAVQYGEPHTRMTSEDAAKARKLIETKAEALEKRWEKVQKEAEAAKFEQYVATQSAEVLKQVNEFPGLDWEEKEAKAIQLTKDIEDPKARAEIRKRLAVDFKEQAITHKANVTLELDELDKLIHQVGPDGSQLTISAQLGAIQSANVSDEAKRRATKGVYDRLNGEDNTALSSAGLAAWRQWRDGEGFTASPEEQRAMMLDLGLNEKDRKAASEYEGLRVEYSQARVFGLITSVYKELKNKPDQLNRIYEAVLAQAKDSKKPLSDKELNELIWRQKNVKVYVEGAYTGPFGGRNMMTFLEGFEATKGQMGQLRFEMPEETAKVLRKQVELLHPWSKDASFLPKYREELLQATYLRMQGITPELSKETEDAIITAQEKYNKRMGLR